jgi:uncharacterized membrane protein YdjX (TVP38/TMEM64 family)
MKKKRILKIVFVLATIVAISLGFYFLFKSLGIANVSGLKELVATGGERYYYLITMLFEVVATILLIIIPGVALFFISANAIIFGSNIGIIISLSYIYLVSFLLYVIGLYGGRKVVEWIYGKEGYEKGAKLLKEHGTSYFPVMLLFPFFPDDLLCFMSGTIRMNVYFYVATILVCRTIGVGVINYGIALIPEEVSTFTSTDPRQYIEVLTIVVFWVILALYLSHRINIWLERKKRKNRALDAKEKDKQ